MHLEFGVPYLWDHHLRIYDVYTVNPAAISLHRNVLIAPALWHNVLQFFAPLVSAPNRRTTGTGNSLTK